MYRPIVIGLFVLFFITIGDCQPKQPKQPTQNPCKFEQPLGETVYDFTSLIPPLEDYVLRNDITNETVKFQLCHELHDDCNRAGGYAACLEYGDQHIAIGAYPPQVTGENGSIVLRFTGDECKKDKRYTLSVIMHCDYSESDTTPVLFPYEKNQCDVFISWKTKLACGSPPKSVNCTVKNVEGDLVDLSALGSQIHNYVIHNISKTSSIVLNVCHSIIPGYGAVCTANSGACLRDESSAIMKYSNIGDVQPPQLINGTVALQYNPGKICGDGTAEHSTTTIFFICDFKSTKTLPVLTNSTGCHYQLLWKTAAACSEKQLREYSLKTASPCKVTNPVTHFQYDLKGLKGQEYIVARSDYSYKISICGPLTGKACEDNAGVCRSPNRTTEGQANSQLLWSPEGPYLNYTNGSICEVEKRHYTIISFTCAPENKQDVPKIVIDVACYLKIEWPTPLVCEAKNITCDSLESHNCSNESKHMTPTTVSSVTPQPTVTPNTTHFDRSTTNNNSITTDSLSEHKAHGGIIAFVVIFIAFGLLCGVYLANPIRRSNFYSACSSLFLRRSPAGMSYSQVNSVEETNLLLDAPDTCCQSDSDDDLLRL